MGVEVLHDNERGPAVAGHGAEELLQRVQPTGGRTQPDHDRDSLIQLHDGICTTAR